VAFRWIMAGRSRAVTLSVGLAYGSVACLAAVLTALYNVYRGSILEAATKVAVAAVRGERARAGTLDQVIFACFNKDALEAYAAEGVAVSQ